MNSINERLAYIIKREGHTVSSFAKKCGLPDPTIRNLLPSAKTNRRPSYDIIVAIIAAVDQPWCDARQITFHTMRHTFCTLLLAKGVPITTVAQLAGHTKIEQTQRYSHIARSMIADDVKRAFK